MGAGGKRGVCVGRGEAGRVCVCVVVAAAVVVVAVVMVVVVAHSLTLRLLFP